MRISRFHSLFDETDREEYEYERLLHERREDAESYVMLLMLKVAIFIQRIGLGLTSQAMMT